MRLGARQSPCDGYRLAWCVRPPGCRRLARGMMASRSEECDRATDPWLLLLLQHILGIITLEDCLLAVLNDDAHAQSRRSGDAPPNHAAILGGEASSRGHGGHGHSHQGGGGGASSRRGGGGSGGGGSLISDATDMQHVARILARRQQHPHMHAHRHLHPHPPAHHPHGGAAAVAAAAPESAEDRDANSS